jgi:hypothetical protein
MVRDVAGSCSFICNYHPKDVMKVSQIDPVVVSADKGAVGKVI